MPLQARDHDDKKQAATAAVASVAVREPELASRALARIQQCIEKAEDQRLKVTATGALSNDQESEIRNSFTLHVKAEIAKILAPLHPADIAYILEALPPDERLIVWDLVRNQQDGEVLLEVNDAVRETLLEAMDREEMVDAMETLDTDEIADLVEDLPPDVVAEVQEGLSSQERAQLRAAMSYPEESVGARMDFEIVSVQEGQSLEAVFRYLRSLDELPELTDMIFVVDRQQKLKGALPVSRILISDPERTVKELMKSDVLTLNPLDDASDAAQAFERYDLVSAPVVDETGRLIGRLTVDEVMDVIRESGDEDHRGHRHIPRFSVIHPRFHEDADPRRSDHPVEQEGNPSDDRTGYRVDQRRHLSDKGTDDGQHCRAPDHIYTVYFCHCHDPDIFSVSRSRHGADQAGDHRGEIIRKQRTVEPRIFQKVSPHDLARDDLMPDML